MLPEDFASKVVIKNNNNEAKQVAVDTKKLQELVNSLEADKKKLLEEVNNFIHHHSFQILKKCFIDFQA